MCVYSACIGAQDPYCGWDMVMKKCTSLEESLSMTQWEQSASSCPVSARPQSTIPGNPAVLNPNPHPSGGHTSGTLLAHPVCLSQLIQLLASTRATRDVAVSFLSALKRKTLRDNTADLEMGCKITVSFLELLPRNWHELFCPF